MMIQKNRMDRMSGYSVTIAQNPLLNRNKYCTKTLTKKSPWRLLLDFSHSPSALAPSFPTWFSCCSRCVSKADISLNYCCIFYKSNKNSYKTKHPQTIADFQPLCNRFSTYISYRVSHLHRTSKNKEKAWMNCIQSHPLNQPHASYLPKQTKTKTAYQINLPHDAVHFEPISQSTSTMVSNDIVTLQKTRVRQDDRMTAIL